MYIVKNLYFENLKFYDLEEFLKANSDLFDWWAFIIHDKDKKSDGELKKAHYHLLIDAPSHASDHHLKEHIQKRLLELYKGNEKQCQIESARNVKKAVRYLTHKDNLEKYQYNDLDVFTSDKEAYQEFILLQVKEKEGDTMLEAIIDDALRDYSKGIPLDNFWFIVWFKARHRLDYYMKNQGKIKEIVTEFVREMQKEVF